MGVDGLRCALAAFGSRGQGVAVQDEDFIEVVGADASGEQAAQAGPGDDGTAGRGRWSGKGRHGGLRCADGPAGVEAMTVFHR